MLLHDDVMRVRAQFLLMLIASVFFTTIAGAQPQLSIPLKIRYGTTDSVTLQFGYDCNATRCLDTLLGERLLPPIPVAEIFDARFVDPRGYDADCADQGFVTDIRNGWPCLAFDTFRIQMQPSSQSASYVLSWPADLNWKLWRCDLVDQFGGIIVNVDMLNDTEKTVPSAFPTLDIHTQLCIECVDAAKPTDSVVPTEFKLYPNSPNPFNPSTVIRYDLPKAVPVTMRVFNLLGQEVSAPLLSQLQTPGTHEVRFDARGLTSGVYFYRITAGTIIRTQKMIVAK